jgi:hypothetical protein
MQLHKYFSWVAVGFFLSATLIIFSMIASFGSHPEPGRWVAECLQKKSIAVSTIKPQVLIISGSNSLFGFSGKILSEKYGVPTVNLAVHAGLGPNYILSYGSQFIEKDRLFVLPFEYELYGHPSSESTFIYQVAGFDPHYFWNMPVIERLGFIFSASLLDRFKLLRYKLTDQPKSINNSYHYDSSSLNDYGDETANTLSNRTTAMLSGALKQRTHNLSINEDVWIAIKKFTNNAISAGGQVALAYPNISNQAIDIEKNNKFFYELRKRAEEAGIILIGKPEESLFPEERIFDTYYHQNRIGQTTSTDRLYANLHQAGLIKPVRSHQSAAD